MSDPLVPLGTAYHELKNMDFTTMTMETFKEHPLCLRDGKAWFEHGYNIVGLENGSTEEARVTLNCSEGHEKSVLVKWFFSDLKQLKCKFCGNGEGKQEGVIPGFLEYKRMDYVVFKPRPGIDPKTLLGRVAKVNKKSLSVMAADGKSYMVKELTAVRRNAAPPAANEIQLTKRKRTAVDNLL